MLSENGDVVKKKPGPNTPCYCGSGLKYKKCHGRHSDVTSSAPSTTKPGEEAGRRKWVAGQVLRDPRLRIAYLVPHEDQDLTLASPLQFYTPGILNTAAVFFRIAEWPATIHEIGASPRHILQFRVLGNLSHLATPIEYSAFSELARHWSLPFKCVVSTDETRDFVSATIAPDRDS